MVLPIQSINSMHGVSCVYTTDTMEEILQKDELLTVISFVRGSSPGGVAKHLSCGLEALENPNLKEAWYSDSVVNSGIDDQCYWSETEECLVAAIWVDETNFEDFSTAVKEGYQRILGFISARGYPNIIRAWNYMADINSGEGDEERYKQFCLGRYEAFEEYNYDESQLPSACALGHTGGDTVIYLLAAKHPGVHFENPQQQSAYHYPREYGPKSPSFARASLVNWENQRQLFISGTASISGNKSLHTDDFDAQLTVTCQNIDYLLKHVAEALGEECVPKPGVLKVYLRHKHDLEAARLGVAKHFGCDDLQVIFVQADICRKELLVEIDGMCSL